jgi:beta-glucanase (GH16 family)
MKVMSKFTFSKTNLSKYVVTYPRYNMSYLVTLELQKLQKEVSKITGKELKLVADNQKEHSFEIVVAGADRKDAPEVTDYDTYIISPVGNKLFVLGGRPYSSAAAVRRLIKLLKNKVAITEPIVGSYEKDVANDKKNYRLTWGDDFDGDKIDETKWEIFYGKRLCYANGVNGKETMRCREDKPNTFIKDGSLYICADQDEGHYYGGMLCTDGIMRYKYGYIEISTIHPKGLGFWTALWLNSAAGPKGDYFTEIDVEECYGNGGDWAYGNTFAWPTKKCKEEHSDAKCIHVNNKVVAKDDRGFWQDYHTFGYEWDENKVTFTCDGFPYVTQDISRHHAEVDALCMPVFIRLSMACGFQSRGGITDDPWEWENTNKFIVDYVNIYQKDGQKLYFGKDGGVKPD